MSSVVVAGLAVGLLAGACAGPNRTEPSFVVTVDLRKRLPIQAPAKAAVKNDDPEDCGTAEVERAEAVLGAVTRELDKAGFEIVPPEPDEDAPAPVLSLSVDIALEECENGLFGDVMVTLTASRTVDRFEVRDAYFSNVVELGRDLGDRVAASERLRQFATAGTSTLSVDRPEDM